MERDGVEVAVMRLSHLAAVVVATLGLAGCGKDDGATEVTILEGRASLASNVTDETATVAFDVERQTGRRIDEILVRNFEVGTTSWHDGQTWHDHGIPTCLSKTPVPVSVGMVDVAPTDDAPGGALLAWLRCK